MLIECYMVNLSFTIRKANGKVVTLTGETDEYGHIYRGGSLIRCSCNTEDPSPYIYDGDIVYCPQCYNTSLNVTHIDNDTDLYLYYIGLDLNTMQHLFKLNATLPYKEWLKVSEYFVKLTPYDVDLDYNIDYVGWVTSTPSMVETVLHISSEKQISNRDIEKELLEELENQNNTGGNSGGDVRDDAYYFDFVDKLHEVFSVVETPYGQFELTGEIIENPLFRPNEHGNGEYWIINKEEDTIWYVRNNYRDGDNLNFNNILVDGELRGIGKVIAYDSDVVELLEKLK